MGDHKSQSSSSNTNGILGIPKTASITDICKSLITKWHPADRNKADADPDPRPTSINEAYRTISTKKKHEGNQMPRKKKPLSSPSSSDDDSDDDGKTLHISHPTLLSRTTSRVSPLQSPKFSSSSMDFFTSLSPEGNTPTTPTGPPYFSKIGSRRCSTATPIFFSQSAVKKKAQPVEKKLECTLEELCHGGAKQISITRDAIYSGLIVEEEETLMIKVKPGWKKGTKITFEGKGDERPGTLPADIIFCVEEKRHPMFKRVGNDLELGVEVPLIQALTGCTVPVPLLGGGQINLSIDDIIYPGYEKIIPGQGMTISKHGKRGDLRLKFLVGFPAELSHDQRLEIVNILEECS